MASTLYADLGGEARLRAVIDRFVDRVVDDLLIGFMFRAVNRERLKRLEYQMAARFLGASPAYEGRPLGEVHAPHRIFGGQFDRRKQILREVLREREVPEHVAVAWLEHTERLRPVVTTDPRGSCSG